MTEQYSILANIKLEEDPNLRLDLGVIFTVKDASFTDFELTLLATNNPKKRLIFGISDAVGKRQTWNIQESEETKNPFYVIVKIKKDGSNANIDLYFNRDSVFKGSKEFFWPINLNPKVILGSPIGGTYPCKISEIMAFEEFLDDAKVNELSDYLENKLNNNTFEKAIELKLGRYAEVTTK